jgi:hypothetical protein
MDEAEAGPLAHICSKWNNPGHSYKKCTEASYFSTATSTPPSSSARGRRFSRYNKGISDNTCLCYRVVIIELLRLVVVL